ncbi:hypothetical protein GQ53DRAFT_333311 [Thozetella sp. PMI_491]|nr:hypothetical protein GQ53DRAFT_333311 [Thozetella sp. PMI_491]
MYATTTCNYFAVSNQIRSGTAAPEPSTFTNVGTVRTSATEEIREYAGGEKRGGVPLWLSASLERKRAVPTAEEGRSM